MTVITVNHRNEQILSTRFHLYSASSDYENQGRIT